MSEDLMGMFRSLQGSLLAHRPHLASTPLADTGSSVPVALLTGFLGAGKSTLLATLLSNPPDASLVKAVVNDVGRLPFDPTLVAVDSEFEVELTNGCGCCGDAGDLGDTLARLARSRPDLLVLEASGIADPFALAQIIEADPALGLDRIVAVVDGKSMEVQLANPLHGPVLLRQVQAAHVIVISHADQLTQERLERVTAILAALAPGRAIVASTLPEPTTDVLLPGSVRGAALPVDAAPAGHRLVTVTAEQLSPVELTEIARALDGLPPTIVRCKGVLRTSAGSVLVQSTPSGTDMRPAQGFGGDAGRGWHGLTIVGTDRAVVQDTALALGCNIPSDPGSTVPVGPNPRC